MLKIKSVSKSFGDIIALEDVSFDLGEGDFIFITGPSGAGKTTLLRLITRDLLPDRGEILLAGHDITKLPHKKIPQLRQRIGFVFQDFKVLPQRTLRENIEVALAVVGKEKKQWKERVDKVLELVELKDRAELFPRQLSGGELQRVSMARALVINPQLILADEPTGNLDWETAERLMDLFEKINKEGKTIIMATHHEGIVNKHKKKTVKLKKADRKTQNKVNKKPSTTPVDTSSTGQAEAEKKTDKAGKEKVEVKNKDTNKK